MVVEGECFQLPTMYRQGVLRWRHNEPLAVGGSTCVFHQVVNAEPMEIERAHVFNDDKRDFNPVEDRTWPFRDRVRGAGLSLEDPIRKELTILAGGHMLLEAVHYV